MSKLPIMFLCILFFLFSCKTINNELDVTTMSKESAINLARTKIIEYGYNPEKLKIEVLNYSTPWNKFFPKDSDIEYDIIRQKKLENKEYWAIYFYPVSNDPNVEVMGGDICIFIDKTSGDILADYRGE